jgi:uncharacterized protein YcbK (DUF882 family)
MSLLRRGLLRQGLGLAAGAAMVGLSPPALALANTPVRRLAFSNIHTGEKLDLAYWENGAYSPQALAAINHVLRDYRTGDEHLIEPALLDLLTALSLRLEARPRFDVISGYRSPRTNAMLRARSHQVNPNSLHMQGQAIDIRMAGVETSHMRDAAQSLAVGGVGYYPVSNFVHVDIGPEKWWSGT